MIEPYGILQEQESINAELGLGVDYYKGEPGEQGIPGKDGKTPVKGVDYFTDAEITEIKDEIAEKVQVGAKGEDGKSAYQLAVEAGYEGSEADWLASLKGTDGRNGIDGINGTNGKDGKTPVKGVDYFTTAEINEIEEGAAAKVDLSNYAKTADLSTVATSGSYNDLSGKPSIPEPYELPVASTTALGGVKVGSGLEITNGVLSANGGAEPDAYIKDASVSGNTLTLTKKDDTQIAFTPSGGSGGGVSGYAFSSIQTFTDEDKFHLKEVYSNKNIHMTIDKLSVIRIVKLGTKYGFSILNTNGSADNQVFVYAVDIDSNENITSSKFSLFTSYYLVGSNNQIGGEIITSYNYRDYFSTPQESEWIYTNDTLDSNFYNAKELILIIGNDSDAGVGETGQYYYNFSKNSTGGETTLGQFAYFHYHIQTGDRDVYWEYNGSAIIVVNSPSSYYFLYKT